MRAHLVPVPILLALAVSLATQAPLDHARHRADDLLSARGIEAPKLSRLALGAFLEARDDYREREFGSCLDLVARVWERAPRGAVAWAELPRQPGGANFGTPTCYYALRMLERCARWRLEEVALPASRRTHPRPIVLTVLLAGHAEGISPRSPEDLAEGRGEPVVHDLEPELLADDHRVIRSSLELFREYVEAMTDGKLSVDVRFAPLPDLRLSVEARQGPPRVAGLAPGAMETLWQAVDAETLASTDWWWLLYPSHVPESVPEFASTEFITGGMDVGPNGGPCFVIDDRWLVRKPPHLGHGPYSVEERDAYLPQWLQHELFHHLFREYPGFGLEAKSHQWFDRASWPDDFEGRFEPDYYAEALEKRLRTEDAQPPLHVKLRYAAPPAELLRKVTASSLAGDYERRPVENDWHRVTLKVSGTDGVTWRNAAGARWKLELDRKRGVLTAGPDCPYYDGESPRRNEVTVAFRRGPDGEFTSEIEGLRWGGELWRRITR